MRVLLAPTVPGWAFDHRARDLLKLKFRHLRLDLKYLRQIRPEDRHKYDLIYPMTLEGAEILHRTAHIPWNKMAAGVTSLRSLAKHRNSKGKFKPEFLRFVKRLRGINTASNEIVALFAPHVDIRKTRVGIDASVFKPAKRPRSSQRPFTVGWVGRIDKPEYRKLKGYDLVLTAVKNLPVKLDIRTYKEHYVPRREMVSFYQKLDCFVCSSASEHIPLPVLEAAACGVPIIATKVGIVPELIRHGANGLIVPRTPQAIRKQIRYLMNSPAEREKLGANIRSTILRHWTWEHCKKDWEQFFLSIGKGGRR